MLPKPLFEECDGLFPVSKLGIELGEIDGRDVALRGASFDKFDLPLDGSFDAATLKGAVQGVRRGWSFGEAIVLFQALDRLLVHALASIDCGQEQLHKGVTGHCYDSLLGIGQGLVIPACNQESHNKPPWVRRIRSEERRVGKECRS